MTPNLIENSPLSFDGPPKGGCVVLRFPLVDVTLTFAAPCLEFNFASEVLAPPCEGDPGFDWRDQRGFRTLFIFVPVVSRTMVAPDVIRA